jgi:hypothetical protein
MEQAEILAAIRAMRLRHRRLIYGLSAFIMALGIAGALGFVKSRNSGPVWHYTLSALCIAGGIYLGRGVRKEPLVGDAERALQHSRDRIVWVYGIRGANTPSRLVLGLDDGAMESAPVPTRRLGAIVSAVGALVPHAALGYDPDVEARFQRAPASVRRGQS